MPIIDVVAHSYKHKRRIVSEMYFDSTMSLKKKLLEMGRDDLKRIEFGIINEHRHLIAINFRFKFDIASQTAPRFQLFLLLCFGMIGEIEIWCGDLHSRFAVEGVAHFDFELYRRFRVGAFQLVIHFEFCPREVSANSKDTFLHRIYSFRREDDPNICILLSFVLFFFLFFLTNLFFNFFIIFFQFYCLNFPFF